MCFSHSQNFPTSPKKYIWGIKRIGVLKISVLKGSGLGGIKRIGYKELKLPQAKKKQYIYNDETINH